MQKWMKRGLGVVLLSATVTGCFRPPYNDFQHDHRAVKGTALSGVVGAGVGAGIGAAAGGPAIGAAAGGVVGTVYGLYKNSKSQLLEELRKQDMQYIEYGDTHTLIIPTDRYFLTNSARFNDICYAGLYNVVRLMRYNVCGPMYVAGFTDAIGNRDHKKKLSQAQADAIVTLLWANGIKAKQLHAEGYGDEYAVGDNQLIHGSAFNRRVEIQWTESGKCQAPVEHLAVLGK